MVMLTNDLKRDVTETWLLDYIEGLDLPDDKSGIDGEFMARVRDEALIEKIANYEMLRMAKRATTNVMPSSLSKYDVAVLLYVLFDFKKVLLGNMSTNTTLMVYVPDNNGFWANGAVGGDFDRKGIYTNDEDILNKLPDIMGLKETRDIKECIAMLSRLCPTAKRTDEKHLTPVKNGIFNNKTKKLEEFTPDYVFTSKIRVNYVPDAIKPIIVMPDGELWDVDSWLYELANEKDDINLLFRQTIHAALYPNRGWGKSIWFYSIVGNNGKGTLGQLMKNLVGFGNYASLSVQDFKHEYYKANLIGVAINIADENDVDKYIDSVSEFKASITGDDIQINIKHRDPISFQFTGLNIQMMNGLPKTKDKTDSFYRRIIIIPFEKSFTNNGERRYIKDEYVHRQDVLEYILSTTIGLEFDEFIVPEASKEMLTEYRENNSPTVEFWNELSEQFVWDLLPTQFLYDLYTEWFKRNNPSGKTIARKVFVEQLSQTIKDDPKWENRTDNKSSVVRSNGRMDDDEPLITEYSLTGWMSSTRAKTPDKAKVRDFVRKPGYRGLLRVTD